MQTDLSPAKIAFIVLGTLCVGYFAVKLYRHLTAPKLPHAISTTKN